MVFEDAGGARHLYVVRRPYEPMAHQEAR